MIHVLGKNLTLTDLLTELRRCHTDLETVGIGRTFGPGVDPYSFCVGTTTGRIVCWSLSTTRLEQVFLETKHLALLKDWLECNTARKCGHNVYGFDYHMFARHGIELQGIVGDTLFMSRLVYCSKERKHDLKDLALNQLGIEQPSFKSLFSRLKFTEEELNPSRTKKGVKTYFDFIETKRKVGDTPKVPTTIYRGRVCKFGVATELIPLDTIATDYPQRLGSLHRYATLGALITRLLFYKFQDKMAEIRIEVKYALDD